MRGSFIGNGLGQIHPDDVACINRVGMSMPRPDSQPSEVRERVMSVERELADLHRNLNDLADYLCGAEGEEAAKGVGYETPSGEVAQIFESAGRQYGIIRNCREEVARIRRAFSSEATQVG